VRFSTISVTPRSTPIHGGMAITGHRKVCSIATSSAEILGDLFQGAVACSSLPLMRGCASQRQIALATPHLPCPLLPYGPEIFLSSPIRYTTRFLRTRLQLVVAPTSRAIHFPET